MPDILFDIIIILLLILLNGLFALSEIAIVSARDSRLQQMANTGHRGAAVALQLTADPTRFLSTVQVGITLVGVFAGAFGGANIAGKLAIPLAELPLIGTYAYPVSFVLVVGTITYLSVVVGELVPKRLALANAAAIAARVARPMQLLSRLVGPVVRLLSFSTDGLLRLFNAGVTSEKEVDEEEIRMLVRHGAQIGAIAEQERDMVESVFRLDDRPLASTMTPRPEIVWLDVNASRDEIWEVIRTANHSRFPVCDGDLDRVLGVVRTKDLQFESLEERPFDLRAMMQEPLFIPERTEISHALERFRQSGIHLALVFDEYGGVEGLVTLIDILEAIVGDIPTPDEIETPPIVQRKDGSWLVEGLIAIADFKAAFANSALPGEGEYQTLGGFMVFMLGKIPMAGEYFTWNGYHFEVADMDGRRVDKVLLQRAEGADGTIDFA